MPAVMVKIAYSAMTLKGEIAYKDIALGLLSFFYLFLINSLLILHILKY